MPLTNPLDTAHTQIWALLEAKSDFLAMFPNGTVHQVRSTTALNYAPDPDLEELNPADYPRCRVVMSQAKPATERDSTNSCLDVEYTIEVCTGQQPQSVMRTATWAIFRAMLGWRTLCRDAITWNSTSCVYDVNAEGIAFTDQNTDRNRGTNQWVAVWSTVIRFYFATADLLAN